MFAVVEVVGIFFAPIVEVGIRLMLGLRDDYCGIGCTSDIQRSAAHVDDLADRLADCDEWNRQTSCGEQ